MRNIFYRLGVTAVFWLLSGLAHASVMYDFNFRDFESALPDTRFSLTFDDYITSPDPILLDAPIVTAWGDTYRYAHSGRYGDWLFDADGRGSLFYGRVSGSQELLVSFTLQSYGLFLKHNKQNYPSNFYTTEGNYSGSSSALPSDDAQAKYNSSNFVFGYADLSISQVNTSHTVPESGTLVLLGIGLAALLLLNRRRRDPVPLAV